MKKIIIELSDAYYNNIMTYKVNGPTVVMESIRHGTIIPSDHGRLIDADKLLEAIEKKSKIPAIQKNADIVNGLCGAVSLIYEAPTVIE